MLSLSPVEGRCPNYQRGCRGKLEIVSSLAGSSHEAICKKCGTVVDVASAYGGAVESDKYQDGRAPQNFAVWGNNIGSAISSRNGSGQSDLYVERGCAGIFPGVKKNKQGQLEVVAMPTLMPGHIADILEPDQDLQRLKSNVTQAMLQAGSGGTEIATTVSRWFRAVKAHSSEINKGTLRTDNRVERWDNEEERTLLMKGEITSQAWSIGKLVDVDTLPNFYDYVGTV